MHARKCVLPNVAEYLVAFGLLGVMSSRNTTQLQFYTIGQLLV